MAAEPATLTPREVAELSGAPKRLVEKAIEERMLTVRRGSPVGTSRRRLSDWAVAYAAIVNTLDLKLGPGHKRRLVDRLASMKAGKVDMGRVEIAPAVEVDVGRLAGAAMERTRRYRVARDRYIVTDEDIMGGAPVIRGTRITVHSVLGRVEHGDSLDEIAAENPHVARDAIEAAVTYARTHPLQGRPGGRPWLTRA